MYGCFETGSWYTLGLPWAGYVAQTGLKLKIPVSYPPNSWNYKYVTKASKFEIECRKKSDQTFSSMKFITPVFGRVYAHTPLYTIANCRDNLVIFVWLELMFRWCWLFNMNIYVCSIIIRDFPIYICLKLSLKEMIK